MALEPRKQAQIDQALQAMGDTYGPLLFTFFTSCKDAGFSDTHALFLTVEHLKALVGTYTPPRDRNSKDD